MTSWIEKVRQTKQRHDSMSCKVYELKIDKSHLSSEKSEYLRKLFLEAKWLYNHILSSEDVFEFDTKPNQVIVLNKDKEKETRDLDVLSSQMKQGIKQRIHYAIKALSITKKKKRKVGRLKFKSEYKSITLNQQNITYRLVNRKYLKLQGSKYRFKIEGLKQIPEDAEITCATINTRHNDYYLKITCFLPKEERIFTGESIGIDFGIKTTLTLDNKEKENLLIPEHKRLRRLRRRMSRKREVFKKTKEKASKNYIRLKSSVNKEYHKLTNRKKDRKNKIVHKIVKEFDIVCVQNENIKGWHKGLFGKQVQHSLMSGIMSDLERKSHTFIKVDRFFPSTQLCPQCGNKKKLGLDERIYVCDKCGYTEDRDVKAAICIKTEGLKMLKKIRMGHTESEQTKVYSNASGDLTSTFSRFSLDRQVESLKEEAPAFRQG